MSYFITPNRNQMRFQELNLDMLIPKDHPVRLFWDACERLNLKRLYEDYKITEDSEGRPPYDPRVLLCLWVYGYSQGIRSARKLAEACKNRADFIWLCGDITPEYRTLAYFRINHSEALEEAFCQFVLLLKKVGLIKETVFFQDGTKIRADVSSDSFRNRDEINQEWARVQLAYQSFVNACSEDTDDEPEVTKVKHRLERKLERIARAAVRVEAIAERRRRLKAEERKQYPPSAAKASITDPDCQFMKISGGGIEPCYNNQITVEGESEFIVAKAVTNEPTDVDCLLPGIEGTKRNLGLTQIDVPYVTDSGYYKDKNIIRAKEALVRDLIMPVYNDRTRLKAVLEVKERAWSEIGKELLRKLKSTIERIFSFIKEKVFGFRRFSLRGCIKVGIEWTFICLSYNVWRYVRTIKGQG